jgi:hypothetical protein
VGIGTDAPAVKLDVEGAVKTSRLGTYGTYLSTEVQGIWSISEGYPIDELNDDFGAQYGMGYAYNQNGGSPFAGEHQIVFTNNGTINAAIGLAGSGYFGGNVGIGKTNYIPGSSAWGLVNGTSNAKGLGIFASPAYADQSPAILELQGSSTTNGDEIGMINFVQRSDFNTDYNFARISAHRENTNATYSSLRFYTRIGATMNEAMIIDENGYVGIGVNPTYKFDVSVPTTYTGVVGQRINFDRTTTGTLYGLYADVDRTTGGGVTYAVYGAALNNGGASTTIGTRGYATGNSTGIKYGIYGSTAGSGTRYAGYFAGDVYCTGSYLPSDENLKRNISDYDNALDQLSSIEVKEYEYKHEGDMSKMDLPKGKQVGIMAQNIEKVFPQLTKNSEFDLNDDPENEDENREENILKFKAVNYTGMVPVLVKAIQEQQVVIDNQKS